MSALGGLLGAYSSASDDGSPRAADAPPDAPPPRTSPSPASASDSVSDGDAHSGSGGGEAGGAVTAPQAAVAPPPPPTSTTPPALIARVAAMLDAVDAGRCVVDELRGRRAYTNPTFLEKAVAAYSLSPGASLIPPGASWDAAPLDGMDTGATLDAEDAAARAAGAWAPREFVSAAGGAGDGKGGGGRRRRWDQ